MDSFGLNLFSDTSDDKTLVLYVAASVDGLIWPDGLPGWADSEPGMEHQSLGHRDGLMPRDETADGDRGGDTLKNKTRAVAFQVARNRPRTLSRKYQRDNGLLGLDYRNIVLSSSERALGEIAFAAGSSRLGGEEVRLMDIPASETGSSGIFDGNITPKRGKTKRGTTKERAEELRADAIRFQGHAGPAFLEHYMQDPHGLEKIKKYKAYFEDRAKLPNQHNAHYRIRSNFALLYAAAALAIDYGILPWGKNATFRDIEKCMRAALAALKANAPAPSRTGVELMAELKSRIETCKIEAVTPKEQPTSKQIQRREEADRFRVDGEIFLKPDVVDTWFPEESDLNALVAGLKEQDVLRDERDDTPTRQRQIPGIRGRPRYYVLKKKALKKAAKGS